jgi:catechol 2,3-dioxygenase-like lactoylglutathione lyase family enzyme
MQSLAMLHHLSIAVIDIGRAAEFYDHTLAALGYRRVWADLRAGEDGQAIGYGLKGHGDAFCIKEKAISSVPKGEGFHIAFSAPSRDAVDAFYVYALAYGGVDNGPPGLRPEYVEAYYACFVLDPDGHHIEAVINRE